MLKTIPYTYADGTTTRIVPSFLVGASTPFIYLITQTYPYHARTQSVHLMTDLMFIVTEDGKKAPWTRDIKDMQTFMQMAHICMGLTPIKGSDGKSRFGTGRLKPTFYNEKTGEYDHESRIKEHDPR